MTVSAWSVIKNEAQFIGYGLMSILPYVDEVVYFDGNSTDGTLKLLDYIKEKYDSKNKIQVHMNKDFSDYDTDYQRVFNECMKACRGDYLWYVHPDMILTDPGIMKDRKDLKSMSYYVNLRSFAGDDMELEITQGRGPKWKTIMKNAFGLKYWGPYGHPDEDMYFGAITGSSYKVHAEMSAYPFLVSDSGVKMSHFCECKPRIRREQKMETVVRTVLKNPTDRFVEEMVIQHPRVHLQSQKNGRWDFEFTPREDPLPEVFEKYKDEFDEVLRKNEKRGNK